MARLGRYFLPEQPLHVIQRGNNRQAIFFAAEDYRRYRQWLVEAAARYGLLVQGLLAVSNYIMARRRRRQPAHTGGKMKFMCAFVTV
jgi:putative transposase